MGEYGRNEFYYGRGAAWASFFDYVDRIQVVFRMFFRRTDGYPVFQACVNNHLSRVCALAGLKDSLTSDAKRASL